MNKRFLLSWAILLALSAGAQALEFQCGSVSINMTQITIGDSPLVAIPCGLQPCLLPPVVAHANIVVLPLCPSPGLIPSPSLSLLCHPGLQPSTSLMLLQAQTGLTPSLHSTSLATLMILH